MSCCPIPNRDRVYAEGLAQYIPAERSEKAFEKSPQVPMALDGLLKKLEKLDAEVAELESRLDPVSSPVDVASGNEKADEPLCCSVAGKLRSMDAALADLSSKVIGMTEALEI